MTSRVRRGKATGPGPHAALVAAAAVLLSVGAAPPANAGGGGATWGPNLGSLSSGSPTQTGRLSPGTPSTCAGRPSPGKVPLDGGLRRYTVLEFRNNFSGPTCVTVTVDPQTCTGAQQIFSAAHLAPFVQVDPSFNYLGDQGLSSDAPSSYSFSVPRNTAFDVVVHEVTPATANCGFEMIVTGQPSVQTGPASQTDQTSTLLTGTINPHGLFTTYRFEFVGGGAATTDSNTIGGGSDAPVSANAAGLQPGTTYTYRLVATNSGGTTTGDTQTFTTLPCTATRGGGGGSTTSACSPGAAGPGASAPGLAGAGSEFRDRA